jgi:hypothetical protein
LDSFFTTVYWNYNSCYFYDEGEMVMTKHPFDNEKTEDGKDNITTLAARFDRRTGKSIGEGGGGKKEIMTTLAVGEEGGGPQFPRVATGDVTTEEQKIVQSLIKQGYTVEVVNPIAPAFNQKYFVYKKTPAGNKVAILNSKGKIIGVQG